MKGPVDRRFSLFFFEKFHLTAVHSQTGEYRIKSRQVARKVLP
ncbi:hypothetical protein POX_b03045 [Penicillium oxalicum]|nr:hypothetical protein POX_b03045 [Penicillium oxalicum]KAI2792999.1 hypothetical protein POX_b03045 [Penicillium oxalicum]